MSEHVGKLLLRLMVGGMMLFHGIDKAVNGIAFIKGLVSKQGLPEVLAYGVYVGEILAPLFLIIGWRSRLWAWVIVLNMIVAIYLTKLNVLFSIGDHGAWAIELPMFYLLSAFVIALIGSGKYAVTRD